MSSTKHWSQGNLLALPSTTAPGEQYDELLRTPNVRVERIISHGQASPSGFWYDQSEDEFVLLVTGAARLEFEDGASVELRANDWVNIPAQCRHRVAWTCAESVTIWLAVFTSDNRAEPPACV
jgi:cupin 2 domain-containing protein